MPAPSFASRGGGFAPPARRVLAAAFLLSLARCAGAAAQPGLADELEWVSCDFSARLLESQLYGVSPTDPYTIGATAALLLLVSIVAMYAPARRAIRVQPVVALNA